MGTPPINSHPNGGNGNGSGSVSPDLWRDLLASFEIDAIPDIALLKQLRAVLFRESGNRDQSVNIAVLLGERGTEGIDIADAWDGLQGWMLELGIDKDDLSIRAGISPVATETSKDNVKAVVEAPDNAAVVPKSDDAGALTRNAKRFAQKSAVSKTSSTHVDVEPTSERGKLQSQCQDIIKMIEKRLAKWPSRYGGRSVRAADEIAKKLKKLKAEVKASVASGDSSYLEDVVDAARILWNRVLKMERELFADTVSEDVYRVRLHDVQAAQPSGSKPSRGSRKGRRKRRRIGTLGKKSMVINALRSEQRGGMVTGLRPHQWDLLEKVQDDWAEHETHGDAKWKAGVIVAPTGSGKTHLMGASIELGMREGWLDFQNGGKAVIMTHLKQISQQNVASMRELLDPVFMAVYGRPCRISFVGDGQSDASGDIVVASVPTVSRNPEKYRQLFKGMRHMLVMQDEYHHSGAASWQKALNVFKEGAGRGYAIGFTATLPAKERASSNIVAELSIREMMREGVLPAVDLIQVRTGVSLARIPTRLGDFSVSELSQTVRNPERYEHMMRVLEFEGVRSSPRALAPMLGFGVDVSHAEEKARYYQHYFSKERKPYVAEDGTKKQGLGVRHIAVIPEGATSVEVERFIEAYRTKQPMSFQHYRYGSRHKGNAPEFVEAGEKRKRVDGIVAVITGKTPMRVRELILEASKRGEVECVINVKALGEGFDAYWIQSEIGAAPQLKSSGSKMVKRAQEVGRILRWGKDEVDRHGRLLRKPRDRVVIDLIDDTSAERPLLSYAQALGLEGIDQRTTGVRIDVKEGVEKGAAYGGVRDVFEHDGTRPAKRKIQRFDPHELTRIAGEREHFLIPEKAAGTFAQALREVLVHEYRNQLDEMAFDIAVNEEMLVGYLNGVVPQGEHIAKRMGVLLYQGRSRFISDFANEALGWKSIDEIPEPMRALTVAVRERAVELFAGKLPTRGFTTAEGRKSGSLEGSSLHSLIREGLLQFKGTLTPLFIRKILLRAFFLVQRDELGALHSIPRGGKEEENLDRLLRPVIEKHLGWKPIEGIPEPQRALVAAMREKVFDLFAGQLPRLGFTTAEGQTVGNVQESPIHRLLSEGGMKLEGSTTPAYVREALLKTLFLVQRDESGTLHSIPRGGKEEENLDRLLRPVIEKHLGWKPTDGIPEPQRSLVAATRDKAFDLFAGQLPKRGVSTEEGQKTGYLIGSPLKGLLCDGKVTFSGAWTPLNAREALLKAFFLVRRDGAGELHSIPRGGKEEKFVNRLLRPLVEQYYGWQPIDGIPKPERALVAAAREKVFDLFAGQSPVEGFTTVEGWESGHLLYHRFKPLLREGVLKFNKNKSPLKVREMLLKSLFLVWRDGQGDLHSIARGGKEEKKLDRVLRPVIEKHLGWRPIEKVPKSMRPLTTAVRDKAFDLFAGKLPTKGVTTAGGQSSIVRETSPLQQLLREGSMASSKAWTLLSAREILLNVLFLVQRDGAGVLHSIPRGGEEETRLDQLLRPVIEQYLGWQPIVDIPEPMRSLTVVVRDKAFELFAGQLPTKGFTTAEGQRSVYSHRSPLHRLLRDGRLRSTKNWSPSDVREALLMSLFLVRRDGVGDLHSIPRGGEEECTLDRLLYPVVKEEFGDEKARQVLITLKGPKKGSGSHGSPAPASPSGNSAAPVVPPATSGSSAASYEDACSDMRIGGYSEYKGVDHSNLVYIETHDVDAAISASTAATVMNVQIAVGVMSMSSAMLA